MLLVRTPQGLLQSYDFTGFSGDHQTFFYGHVVGEQLQGHNLEIWQQQFRRLRNKNCVIGKLKQFLVIPLMRSQSRVLTAA